MKVMLGLTCMLLVSGCSCKKNINNVESVKVNKSLKLSCEKSDVLITNLNHSEANQKYYSLDGNDCVKS